MIKEKLSIFDRRVQKELILNNVTVDRFEDDANHQQQTLEQQTPENTTPETLETSANPLPVTSTWTG